jgi:hypothetical protein
MSDRHFDQLATRFAEKIYGGAKGAIRLAVLQADLTEALPSARCACWISAPGWAICRCGWPSAGIM